MWNISLQLQRGSNISLDNSSRSSSATSSGHNAASGAGSGSLWITDCVLMNNCNKLVVAVTSNELLFLDMSTMLCHCQHRIVGQLVVIACATMHSIIVCVCVCVCHSLCHNA